MVCADKGQTMELTSSKRQWLLGDKKKNKILPLGLQAASFMQIHANTHMLGREGLVSVIHLQNSYNWKKIKNNLGSTLKLHPSSRVL